MGILAFASLIYYIALGSVVYLIGELLKRHDEVTSYFKNGVINVENQENDIARILRIIGFLIQIMAITLVAYQFINTIIIIDKLW